MPDVQSPRYRVGLWAARLPTLASTLTLVYLSLIILLAACTSQPLTVTRAPVTLHIAVSDSCQPLMAQLSTAYQQAHPWITLETKTFNSTFAERQLRAGAVDMAALTWMTEQDTPTALWSTPFAIDGIVIITHPAVPTREISLAQLREIFRGRIAVWEDGSPIQVVSREAGAGIRFAFEKEVMEGYPVTLTAVVMPNNAQVIDYVAATPGAIGYVSMGHVDERAHTLTLEGVPPSPSNLQDYPLTYSPLLVTPDEPTGEARAFIQWALSPEGQREVARHLAPPP